MTPDHQRPRQPLAGIKPVVRSYWNWRSASYGYDGDISRSAPQTWQNILHRIAGPGKGRAALDLGTGTGQFALYLADLGFRVTGVDLSEKMLGCARQAASARGLDICFEAGDAESLVFPNNTFDILVSRNLLWTLPSPQKAMAEWHRVLKPGGRIILSDGLWQNATWKTALKRLPFRGLLSRGCRINMRFFMQYAVLQRHLPFYEGIGLEQTRDLMSASGFSRVRSWDVQEFESNPYGGDKDFFIAYAQKLPWADQGPSPASRQDPVKEPDGLGGAFI